MVTAVKRLLVGKPLKTQQAVHERLTKKTALAVFSSDALSSTAYATEEILLVLAAAVAFGQGYAFHYVIPISIGIAVLLAIVATSYRQTIHAYPSGGGAYIVAKENLGDQDVQCCRRARGGRYGDIDPLRVKPAVGDDDVSKATTPTTSRAKR